MLKLGLRIYSDAYILMNGTIAITGEGDVQQKDREMEEIKK